SILIIHAAFCFHLHSFWILATYTLSLHDALPILARTVSHGLFDPSTRRCTCSASPTATASGSRRELLTLFLLARMVSHGLIAPAACRSICRASPTATAFGLWWEASGETAA